MSRARSRLMCTSTPVRRCRGLSCPKPFLRSKDFTTQTNFGPRMLMRGDMLSCWTFGQLERRKMVNPMLKARFQWPIDVAVMEEDNDQYPPIRHFVESGRSIHP